MTDASGAAVAGAAVQVVNEETNLAATAVSNEAGNYQAPLLLPGNYRVRVEMSGFKMGLEKPPVNYYQWGWVAGGPVIVPKLYSGKNRTFFFLALERDDVHKAISRQSRVPTEAERGGDFSQTLSRAGGAFAVFDPATTVVSGSRATRQPFPGARIPSARFNPTMSQSTNKA